MSKKELTLEEKKQLIEVAKKLSLIRKIEKHIETKDKEDENRI